MSTPFDFKVAARELMNRIYGNASGAPVNKDLVRTVIEVALRDAYNKGLGEQTVRATAPPVEFRKDETVECAHQWQESFLDGRAVGVQCSKCGILERDLKSQCDHFFVKNGPNEVCVACRTSRRARG